MRTSLAIILAAGESSRMKSSQSKVLHKVAGKPIISHMVDQAHAASIDHIAVIVGRDAEQVEQTARASGASISAHVQTERLGTANAVLAARSEIAKGYDDLLCLVGDAPLLSVEIFQNLRAKLQDGADVVVAGFEAQDPFGYGRMVMEGEILVDIVEEKEASDAQRKISFCNSGIIAVRGDKAVSLIDQITNDNIKGEYYLTDIVKVARTQNLRTETIMALEADLMGCNTRAELSEIEAEWQKRKRLDLMLSGVTMLAPETVFFCHDTQIAQDVTIEPNVIFGPGVTVEEGATILGFSHIEGAHISKNATVGPFARLRPGAKLAENSKVGNFCEIKKATIGARSKVNHLSYIGDASVGQNVNIGAGTITCNYDGHNKHLTSIGDDVFVGSNSLFVAPVSVGSGAMTATGTVVTKDVPGDALAISRSEQLNKPGTAKKIQERNRAIKERNKESK